MTNAEVARKCAASLSRKGWQAQTVAWRLFESMCRAKVPATSARLEEIIALLST